MEYIKLVKEGLEFSLTFSLIIVVLFILRYQREVERIQLGVLILMVTFQYLVVGPLAIKIKERAINEW